MVDGMQGIDRSDYFQLENRIRDTMSMATVTDTQRGAVIVVSWFLMVMGTPVAAYCYRFGGNLRISTVSRIIAYHSCE